MLPPELPRVHLAASEVCLARTPTVIETVLGSCVAATFWSPRFRVGAMCHGALPCCPQAYLNDGDSMRGLRYVDYAIGYLVERFTRLGVPLSEVVVKLFGGADMLKVFTTRSVATVGRQNCVSALETLKQHGLQASSTDLGGRRGRVIYFRTDTGEILMRRLPGTATSEDDDAVANLLLEEDLP